MDELDQLFKDILAARHEGASEADINAALKRGGHPYANEAAVRQALAQRDAAHSVPPGKVAGTAEAFGHGASLGFSDELGGLLSAMTSGPTQNPLTAYRQGRDVARGRNEAFAQSNPKLSLTGNLLGGGALAGATAGLLTPAISLGGLAAQGAGAGAAFGALQGAGDAATLADVPKQMLLGGLGGGVVGGVAAPLTDIGLTGLGAIYRGGRAILAPQADAAASRLALMSRFLTPDAVKHVERLMAARPDETMTADANPSMFDVIGNKSTAFGEAADAAMLARNAQEGGRLASGLESAAGGRVAIAAGRQTPSATDLATSLENAATGRVPGQAGPGIDAVGSRVEQVNLKSLRERLFVPLQDRYRVTPDDAAGVDLINLLGTDEEVARVFGKVVPKVERRVATQEMQRHDLTPGFRSWQSTLDQLDDEASAAYAGNRGNQGNKLAASAQALRTRMEEAFPDFKAANDAYRIPKEIMEAQTAGQAAGDPRKIATDLARWEPNAQTGYVGNPDAQSAYRMAALDPIVQRLRGLAPDAKAFRIAIQRGDQDLTPRLQALFPRPADLDRFLADVAVTRAGHAGRTAMNHSADEIAAQVAELAGNPRAQTAYRMNALTKAVRGLRGIRPEANAFREALVSGNQDLTPRLQALFPRPQDLDAFLADASVAQQFRRTLEARTGSKTHGRSILESEVFGTPGLGRGGPLARLTRLFENMGTAGRDARIAEAAAPDIFATGAQNIRPVIARVQATQAAQAARDAMSARAGLVGAGVAGRFPTQSALLAYLAAQRLPFLGGRTAAGAE